MSTYTTGAGELVMRWKQESTAYIKQMIPRLKSMDVLEPFERISMLLNELVGKRLEKTRMIK